MKKNFLLSTIAIAALFISDNIIAKELTWNEAAQAAMSATPNFDYKDLAVNYMYIFEPKMYEKYHNDEFEFEDKINETITKMKSAVTTVNMNTEYTIDTIFMMNKYNFENNTFPIAFRTTYSNRNAGYIRPTAFPNHAIEPGLRIVLDSTNYILPDDKFFSRYELGFINSDAIKPISMEKDLAKAFVKANPLPQFEQYREIGARITFKLNAFELKDSGPHEWKLKITKIEYFANKEKFEDKFSEQLLDQEAKSI